MSRLETKARYANSKHAAARTMRARQVRRVRVQPSKREMRLVHQMDG